MNLHADKPRIRVLIVDDSAFMRTALSRMVTYDPVLSVAGVAANGSEALQQIPALDPDVITLDVQMPGLDGLETLRAIMAQFPRPVIMVSSVTQKNAETTLSALAAGAFDCVPKRVDSATFDILQIRSDLISRIKAAAESRAPANTIVTSRKPPRGVEVVTGTPPAIPAIVAIGISTGGPKALQDILPFLPDDLPVPVIIVQHMPLGFTAPFAKRLDNLCAASVSEAIHGQTLDAGAVYIAPAGLHLTVQRASDSRGMICLSDKPDNQRHVPSVDVMMLSVASAFRSRAMGIIMTGMGSDGAHGMTAIHQEGGITLGQDEASCAVYGMPRVCAELGILDRVAPLLKIPQEILQATRYRKTALD